MSFNPDAGSSSISGATDASINDLQDDQVLAYDQPSDKWHNKAMPGGTITSVNGQTGTVVLDSGHVGAVPLGGTVTLAAADGVAAVFNIDGEDANGSDRLQFRVWKNSQWRPVSWFNEYGEVRIIPSASSRVGFRIFGATNESEWNSRNVNSPIMNVENYRDGTGSRVTVWSMNHRGDTSMAGDLVVGGTITAPNIGHKVTTANTAPSSPQVNDVWVDTSSSPGSLVTASDTEPSDPAIGDVWIDMSE